MIEVITEHYMELFFGRRLSLPNFTSQGRILTHQLIQIDKAEFA